MQRILEQADSDNNGQIEFGEFINIMKRHWREPESVEDLTEAFQLIDVNKDGSVDVKELTNFLTSFGEALSEQEVKAVVSVYDMDGDGKLNYKEFIGKLLRSNIE